MVSPDPLLDPPSWVPSWFSIDDVRTVRRMMTAVCVVAALSFGACVIESADQPADPQLVTSSTIEVPTSLGGPVVGSAGVDGCPATAAGEPGSTLALVDTLGTATARIRFADGATRDICVLVADESSERQRGLMQVTDFTTVEGMVFVHDTDVSSSFFMFRTPTPLSISWWAADGSFVSRAEMRPCLVEDAATCERFTAAGSYRIALEVPQSIGAELVLGPGDRLEIIPTP